MLTDFTLIKNKKVFIATKMENQSSISYADVGKILSNLSDKNGEVVNGSQFGYHSLLSVVGNGRFRDRGVSSRLIAEILKRKSLVNKLDIKFKVIPEKAALEPIIGTQSLQKLISELKSNIQFSENDLCGEIKYKNTSITLTPFDVHRLNQSI